LQFAVAVSEFADTATGYRQCDFFLELQLAQTESNVLETVLRTDAYNATDIFC
jgi:hypothetical protein